MKYYILIDKKTAGPYTLEQVKALYDSGVVESTHQYATTESQDWLPVSMLVPLFNVPVQPSVPLPSASQPTIVINNTNNNGNSGNLGYPSPVGIGNQRSRIVYQLLAWFFGYIGINDFYAGYTRNGWIKLLVTICTCGYGGVIMAIWSIVQIFTVKVDADGIPMR